jgi:hypothetical protein
MRRSVIAAAALVLLAAGCTSSSGSSSSGTASGRVLVDEHDNGRTVRVDRGGVVELRLHSTYWQLDPAAGGVLVVSSRAVIATAPNGQRCVAGQGCGTVAVDLSAAHSGRVTLRAHRASCGEALRCTGSNGSFAVQVVVG